MTPQQSKKLELVLFIGLLIVLTIVWRANGYEDTWLYITAAIIAIPISWYSFGKKSND